MQKYFLLNPRNITEGRVTLRDLQCLGKVPLQSGMSCNLTHPSQRMPIYRTRKNCFETHCSAFLYLFLQLCGRQMTGL